MADTIKFVLDDKLTEVDFQSGGYTPTTTVLNYLRSLPGHRGVKEGCAEGDCGACTVVLGELNASGKLEYRAIDSCLLFLPMLHGKQLITVENLQQNEALHPVQQSMVEQHGSQCGFCTPGIVMSMFALYKNVEDPDRETIDDALTGNLCRCTGYRPIVEAAATACVQKGKDPFTASEKSIIKMLQNIPAADLDLSDGPNRYLRPAGLQQALQWRKEFPDALVINGATDVALRVTKKHEQLPLLLDLGGVRKLELIEQKKQTLRIGAGARLNSIKKEIGDLLPAMNDMLAVFGSPQIRNLATLGGSLGTASPIGDPLPLLIAYRASVELQSIRGKRCMPVTEFVTGYRQTVCVADELITAVEIPLPPDDTTVKFYKISKRRDLDIATVSGGFRLRLNSGGVVEEIVLAYGGMAETIRRAQQAEAFLTGKSWIRENVEQAMELVDAEFTPISDARASAEGRRVMARNLVMRFFYE